MLDHIQLKVRDWPRARAYYSAVLEPLGYTLFVDNATWGGFHVPGEAHGNIYVKQEEHPLRLHCAIAAPSAAAVKASYTAAIAHGGTDNGGPGYRAHFRPGGTGAFVIDLDNNNIEVVHH